MKVYVGLRADTAEAGIVRYAAANEFGVPGRIPQRSFLRSTAREQASKWAGLMQTAAGEVLDGGSVQAAFGRVGLVAVGDVRRKIVQLKVPPNAPSTVRRKGSNNPLVDTGRMGQSIDYRVVTREAVPPPPKRSVDLGGELSRMRDIARGGG